MKNNPLKEKKDKSFIIGLILLLLSNIILFVSIWLIFWYDNIAIDQILYLLKAPRNGVNSINSIAGVIVTVILGLATTFLEIFIYLFLSGKWQPLKRHKKGIFIDFYNKKYLSYMKTKTASFFKKAVIPVCLSYLLIVSALCTTKLNLADYIVASSTESDFIAQHYVSPENVKITFPQKKRNLIFIYLESMENIFADKNAGGNITENFIPELSLLAEENINFSNTSSLGGALSYAGTTWTAAAMVSATSGMTVKVPFNSSNYGGENSFIPGLYSLGEVLQKEGYNQKMLFGSDSAFAGKDSYFKEHGNIEIVDINSLKEEGRLEKDYFTWWGYEDKKLFSFAKEEILDLAEKGEPFSFTMLTADTHFPGGYTCEDCQKEHASNYANVLSCSSKKVSEFIRWIKAQDFYKDTCIILSGDHLTMDPEFLKNSDPLYTRTIYNCFINSSAVPIKEKERLFGTFDLFPTTLAAMGVTIEGDCLGLGVNLFSDKKTLTERYSFSVLDMELKKKSSYYNEKMLGMENENVEQ